MKNQIKITEIVKDSNAEKSGLLLNDIILQINKVEIKDTQHFSLVWKEFKTKKDNVFLVLRKNIKTEIHIIEDGNLGVMIIDEMDSKFEDLLKPYTNVKVPNEIINEFNGKIPSSLIKLWTNFGFGKYGQGIIELVNPKKYEEIFWNWINEKPENCVPFAISAFGDLFYYVRYESGEDEIRLINPNRNEYETICYSGEGFFSDFFQSEFEREDWLFESVFKKAIKKLGPLKIEEVYSFKNISKKANIYKLNNIDNISLSIQCHNKLLKHYEGKDIELYS
jgi:hypothetical protein